ncbi:M48 family metalloprotease [Povalibacter sp.]|uniref:M48 family metalloprotease n=1 Tax=Povalibacter sp. TaxID=1962978 RepID=UPI002F42C90D
MQFARVILIFAATAWLSACGVNPVTGKKEIQFVSEAQELQIGAQHYEPTRQSEGGDFTVDPQLTAYVSGVGQKLAAFTDRKLPYEFVVLNNSVPNAWALPGGKIAVNRGLLTELQNEAELAAVLGHEIVHAAARHGAKAQERGTLLQAGMAAAQIGAAIGGVDAGLASMAIQGAGVGAQMVQMKYGRDQELESDFYGMKYMKLAGYDPWGGVTLQQTFLRLSESGGAKQQNWMEGLFASHPPSAERVQKNEQTATNLGRGGDLGTDRYVAATQQLRQMKPAYDKFDQAVAATRKKDFATAKSLAGEAAKAVPQEGRFQELLGEIALAEKNPQQATTYYQKAIQLNPSYFGSYLGGGVAQLQLGNKAKAQEWLTKSSQLLPTAPAAYYLGNIARDSGDTAKAQQYYKAAATSDSSIGKAAAAEYMKMDLPQNPGNYVATTGQLDAQGRVIVVVQNRSPVALSAIQVTPVLVDASGRILQQGNSVTINAAVKSGEQAAAATGLANLSQEQLQALRFRVDGAKIAE